jgi:hypothetical protein
MHMNGSVALPGRPSTRRCSRITSSSSSSSSWRSSWSQGACLPEHGQGVVRWAPLTPYAFAQGLQHGVDGRDVEPFVEQVDRIDDPQLAGLEALEDQLNAALIAGVELVGLGSAVVVAAPLQGGMVGGVGDGEIVEGGEQGMDGSCLRCDASLPVMEFPVYLQ